MDECKLHFERNPRCPVIFYKLCFRVLEGICEMYTLSFQKYSLQAEENGLWRRSGLEEVPASDPGASNINTLVFLSFIVSLHIFLPAHFSLAHCLCTVAVTSEEVADFLVRATQHMGNRSSRY